MIRPANLNDIQKIADCEKLAFSTPLSLNSIESILKNPLYNVFIAENEGEFLGYSILYTVTDETGGECISEISSIAVMPTHRSKGAGTALLTAMIYHCRIIKSNRILLEVRISNINAMSLYGKMGFLKIARRKDFYEKPVEDAFTMEFKITN